MITVSVIWRARGEVGLLPVSVCRHWTVGMPIGRHWCREIASERPAGCCHWSLCRSQQSAGTVPRVHSIFGSGRWRPEGSAVRHRVATIDRIRSSDWGEMRCTPPGEKTSNYVLLCMLLQNLKPSVRNLGVATTLPSNWSRKKPTNYFGSCYNNKHATYFS